MTKNVFLFTMLMSSALGSNQKSDVSYQNILELVTLKLNSKTFLITYF
jgi:hypothetical protein